jgi:hypothetical protein
LYLVENFVNANYICVIKETGVRPIGRPRKRWMDGVQTNAKDLLKVKNWKAQALDRNGWRHIIGKAEARFGL